MPNSLANSRSILLERKRGFSKKANEVKIQSRSLWCSKGLTIKIHSLLAATLLTTASLPYISNTVAQAAPNSDPTNLKVPAEVLANMRPGGISLRYQILNIGPNGAPIGAHVYVIPAGRIKGPNNYHSGALPAAGSPFTRSDIAPGPGSLITDSPYYLELFAPSPNGGKLKSINVVRFIESRDVNGISVTYLEPKLKRGPMLLLGFSSLGTYDITVATFPSGLTSPASIDRFSGGGAGGGGTQLDFTGVDKQGITIVQSKPYTKMYNDKYQSFVWNGQHFAKAALSTSDGKVQTVTEENNGTALTLDEDETLVVRLPDMASTGSVWSLVTIPGMPFRMISESRLPAKAGLVGAPGIHEWRFIARPNSFGQMSYLKLLQLRPFEAGIMDAKLWEVQVSVPASKAAK